MGKSEYEIIVEAIRSSVAISDNVANGNPRVVTGWLIIVEIAETNGVRGLAAMRDRTSSPHSRIGWLTDLLGREKRLLAFGQNYSYQPPPPKPEDQDADK
jgi:hypothetical protein